MAYVEGVRRRPRSGLRRLLYEMRREWSAYLYISPGLLMFIVFTAFALGFSLYISFHEWSLIDPAKPFVGLDNYEFLKDDSRFRTALFNTAYFTLLSVPLGIIVGLLLALLLNKEMRARSMFRTLFFIPSVTPFVIAAIIWKWVYNADFGLLNYYLQKFGIIDEPLLWLADPNLAMPAIVLMSVWAGAGGTMLLYLAGLQSIPDELYEAAKVDGAGPWQRLRYVTFPMLAPTTLFLIVVGILGSFQVFVQIFVMTSGGPLDRTTTIAYYIYQTAFKFYEMGYATAISWVLFAILFVFTVIQFRMSRRWAEF
jgi:multiple sugar transport system permease protein